MRSPSAGAPFCASSPVQAQEKRALQRSVAHALESWTPANPRSFRLPPASALSRRIHVDQSIQSARAPPPESHLESPDPTAPALRESPAGTTSTSVFLS